MIDKRAFLSGNGDLEFSLEILIKGECNGEGEGRFKGRFRARVFLRFSMCDLANAGDIGFFKFFMMGEERFSGRG